MKKSLGILALAIVLFASVPMSLSAVPYDSATVKDFMHRNAGDLGKAQESLKAGDFAVLATAFSDFLATAKVLHDMDPPKGDPAVWQGIWNDFSAAAAKGVAAAKDKDAAKASEALASLRSLMGQGHRNFRG